MTEPLRSPAVDKTPTRIAGMFDAIAPRYDLLNHVLSAGLDRRWRNRAVDALGLEAGARLLDLCTGTGDLAMTVVRRSPGSSVVGVDFAAEMLRLGRDKVRQHGLETCIRLVRGDATRIPLADASCDAATVGFGIRNVAEPLRALAELARVLRPGGRLAILEFGEPRIPGVRTLYAWYFRYVLPLIGRTISRHDSAYSYLPASVVTFPSPSEFLQMCESSGFSRAQAVPLTFGIVYLYVAQRGATRFEGSRVLKVNQSHARIP
jgi:demethylmenaquinone methyltransferase/2-methoxy-6-polyprenyl-1,4-benzoquinol methylase